MSLASHKDHPDEWAAREVLITLTTNSRKLRGSQARRMWNAVSATLMPVSCYYIGALSGGITEPGEQVLVIRVAAGADQRQIAHLPVMSGCVE